MLDGTENNRDSTIVEYQYYPDGHLAGIADSSEWDSQHGEVEKYDKQGKHLGAYDKDTGAQIKGPVPGRKCVK